MNSLSFKFKPARLNGSEAPEFFAIFCVPGEAFKFSSQAPSYRSTCANPCDKLKAIKTATFYKIKLGLFWLLVSSSSLDFCRKFCVQLLVLKKK